MSCLCFDFFCKVVLNAVQRFEKHMFCHHFFKLVPPVFLPRLHVMRPRRCKPSTVGRRQTPQLFSPVFPPWEPHRLHVIRLHRCKPSTVGRRQTPQLSSPVFPPWELHRLHVIRLHRCKPSTVGRRQKPQLFSPVFPPLGAPQVSCHQASPLQTIYGRETPNTTAIFTRFSPLGSPTGYMS